MTLLRINNVKAGDYKRPERVYGLFTAPCNNFGRGVLCGAVLKPETQKKFALTSKFLLLSLALELALGVL